MLGTEVIDASSSACLLGVTFTPDLWLEKHASIVSGRCFFSYASWTCTTFTQPGSGIDARTFIPLQPGWLLQLFNGGSTEEVDRETPTGHQRRCPHNRRCTTGGLTWILHDELHWLDISQRIQFKLFIHVYKCLHGIAPKYMMDLCRLVPAIEGRSHLHSAARGQLDVSRPKLSTYGRRAFSYAGQSTWNSLPNYLKDSCHACLNDR